MAVHTWSNGGGTNVWSLAANWNGGKPVGGGDVVFDATSTANCLMDEASADLASIDVQAAYSGVLDLGTDDLTVTGNVTFASAGEVDLGTGTHRFTDSVFTLIGQTTFTAATSTVIMAGTGSIVGHAGKDLWKLTIASGATITTDAGSDTAIDINGQLEVIGDLVLNKLTRIGNACDVIIRATATISGGRSLHVRNTDTGHGIITHEAGSAISAQIIASNMESGSIFAAGTYAAVLIENTGAATNVLELSAGVYTFASLELQSGGGGDYTLDTATACDWIFQGDWIDQRTGGGTFNWIRGTGDITLSGAANQDIDTMGQSWEDTIINKAAGTVTLQDDFDAVSLTLTDGTLDVAGFDIDTDGDFTATDGAGITNLGGSTVTVGGNLSMGDSPGGSLDLAPGAAWTLTVSGTATASFADFGDCDASGGTQVDASDGSCIDSGGNANVLFWVTAFVRSVTWPDLSGLGRSYEGLHHEVGPFDGHWPLQEVAGLIAHDLSGPPNAGLYINSPSLGSQPGPIARVAGVSRFAQFDGVDQRVDIANVANMSATPQTFSLWVKPDDITNRGYLLSAEDAGGGFSTLLELQAIVNNGDLHFLVSRATGSLEYRTPTGVLTNGIWTHVGLTWDGTTDVGAVSLRLDGASNAMPRILLGAGAFEAATGLWVIGGRTADNLRNFEGGLAHVAWINSQLTLQQIKALYLCGRNGQ